MRYFTAGRWLRLQARQQGADVLAALEEWEEAGRAYLSALGTWLPRRGTDLAVFATSVCLHDAILERGWRDGGRLQLLVRLPLPLEGLVVLDYSLVSPPEVTPSGIPPEYHTAEARWMYDELDREGDAGRPVYSHRILLSDGREVRIRFRRFRYALPLDDPLRPADGVRMAEALA